MGVAEVAAAIVVACGVTAARELRGSALAAVRATAAARMKGLAADDERKKESCVFGLRAPEDGACAYLHPRCIPTVIANYSRLTSDSLHPGKQAHIHIHTRYCVVLFYSLQSEVGRLPSRGTLEYRYGDPGLG